MGWDAFGLPAEQYAIETERHPRITTQQNIDTFRRQIKSLGFCYDWDREVDTTDPDYFKWTQWIFLTIYDTWYDAASEEGPADQRAADPRRRAARRATRRSRKYQDAHRLAYQAEVPVNWCPALGTVLANEEVDRRQERSAAATRSCAGRCGSGCCASPPTPSACSTTWSRSTGPQSIKEMQRNWIGKSEGAEVDFRRCTSQTPMHG